MLCPDLVPTRPFGLEQGNGLFLRGPRLRCDLCGYETIWVFLPGGAEEYKRGRFGVHNIYTCDSDRPPAALYRLVYRFGPEGRNFGPHVLGQGVESYFFV